MSARTPGTENTTPFSWFTRLFRSRETGIFLALLVMFVVLSLVAPSFRTADNMINMARNLSFVGMVAVGQTMVIATGGIDLSVGSIWGMTAIITSALLAAGWPIYGAIPVGLLSALAIGLFNGLCVTKLRMPPFIPTLASLSIARSIALVVTRGRPITDFGPQGNTFFALGGGSFLGIPNPIWIFLVIAILGWILLNRTVWGRHLLAIGGNERAARLTGLPVDRVKLSAYLISALLAGIAGIVEASYLSSGTSNQGTGKELNVIATSVIGGTNLTGGEASILGTVIGAVILEVLRNGLLLLGIDPYLQGVFVGLVIVAAVFIDQLRKRSRRS